MVISYNTRPFIDEDFELMCRVFKALDFGAVELHLGHFIDRNLRVNTGKQLLDKYELPIIIVDGGWCDLSKNMIEKIPKQVELVRELGCDKLRLFFTPLKVKEMGEEGITAIHHNIGILAEKYPDIQFLFESHKGIGVDTAQVFAFMMAAADNIGLVFDPINIMVDGMSDPWEFLNELKTFVKHVHLKGANLDMDPIKKTERIIYCPFGEGNLSISNVSVEAATITGSVGIEYEGTGNAFMGLLRSKENFEAIWEESLQ